MRVYVAGAIHGGTWSETCAWFDRLAGVMREAGADPVIPTEGVDPACSPSQIYLHCIDLIERSHAMIAVVERASTGVGLEIGIAALDETIPVIVISVDGACSEFVVGAIREDYAGAVIECDADGVDEAVAQAVGILREEVGR